MVDAVVKILTEDYVEEELGEKMANALKVHHLEGDYGDFKDSGMFAERLTEDLHEVGHGKHHSI